MPDDNPILRHWQTEVQAFDQNFTVLQSKMDIDAIHDLRVAIKKIHSYVKLYPSLFKKKEPEELLAMLRGLFSVFGKHRNIDIVRKLLPSFFEKNKPLPKSLFVYLHLLQDQKSSSIIFVTTFAHKFLQRVCQCQSSSEI